MAEDHTSENRNLSLIVKLQSSSLDLVADLFQGFYVLLWNPMQHIQLTEASVLGHIISAPESEVSFMGSIMSISSLRKVISGIFSMENILTVIQIQQCLSLNSISVNSHDNGSIPAPAVLEVGSDKIWALLVLSELFGLRAVVAQCSQRLCRLCQAKNPLDTTGERRMNIPAGLRRSLLEDDVADIEIALTRHFAAYPPQQVVGNLTASPDNPVEVGRITYPNPPAVQLPPSNLKAPSSRSDITAALTRPEVASRVKSAQDDIKIRDSYSPSPNYFHFQRYIHQSPPSVLRSSTSQSLNRMSNDSVVLQESRTAGQVVDGRSESRTTSVNAPVEDRDRHGRVRYVLTSHSTSMAPTAADAPEMITPKGSGDGSSKHFAMSAGEAQSIRASATRRSLSAPRTAASAVFSSTRTSPSSSTAAAASSSSSSSPLMYRPLSAVTSSAAISAALAAEKETIRTRLKSLSLKTAVIRIKNAHKVSEPPAPPLDRPPAASRPPSPPAASSMRHHLSESALAAEERKYRMRVSEEGYDGTYSSYRSRVKGRRVATQLPGSPSTAQQPDHRSKSPKQQAALLGEKTTPPSSNMSMAGSSQKNGSRVSHQSAAAAPMRARPSTPSPKGNGLRVGEISPHRSPIENEKRVPSPSMNQPASERRHRSPPREISGGRSGSIRSSDKVAELRRKSSLISYRYRYATAASMTADEEAASDIERDIIYTATSWAAVSRGMSPSKSSALSHSPHNHHSTQVESDSRLLTSPAAALRNSRMNHRTTSASASPTPTSPSPSPPLAQSTTPAIRSGGSKSVSPSSGGVTVVVVRAWALREVIGGSNPYVVVDWGPCGKHSTQAVMDSTEPYFGSVLKFKSPFQATHRPAMAVMKVYVYSRNLSTSDELLGYVELNSEGLLALLGGSSECATMTYQLVDLLDKQNPHAGCIQLTGSL